MVGWKRIWSLCDTALRRLPHWWWMVLLCAPPLLIVLLIAIYGSNTPFWDEWELVPFFQKQDAHTLSLYDFWQQHNEHRILFPSLLAFGLAYITGWNIVVEMYVSVVLACAAFFLIFDMIRQTFAGQRTLKILASILAACLFFSPMQWENWLWGWQIEWYMNLLGIVATIWAFCYWPARWSARWQLPAAVLAATIATYSLGSGPLIWFVGLGLLVLKRSGWRRMVVWTTSGAIILATYYYHYDSNAGEPSKTLIFQEPLKFGGYIAGYIGHPLGWNWISAACFGIALACLAVWLLWRYWRRGLTVSTTAGWLALGAYAAGCAITTGLSRVGFGVTQSFSSRYFTLSMLFFLSCAVLLAKSLQARQRKLAIASLAIFIVIVVGNYVPGVRTLVTYGRHIAQEQQCTRQPHPTIACLTDTFPDPKITLERLNFLKEKHWAGY